MDVCFVAVLWTTANATKAKRVAASFANNPDRNSAHVCRNVYTYKLDICTKFAENKASRSLLLQRRRRTTIVRAVKESNQRRKLSIEYRKLN